MFGAGSTEGVVEGKSRQYRGRQLMMEQAVPRETVADGDRKFIEGN